MRTLKQVADEAIKTNLDLWLDHKKIECSQEERAVRSDRKEIADELDVWLRKHLYCLTRDARDDMNKIIKELRT